MSSSDSIPLQVSGYYILLLSLPPLPSFPTAATHYLYLANHQPKNPSPTSYRSLFLINVPFDATDALLKHLLSTQLGLPNGRIEDVQFEGQTGRVQNHTEAAAPHTTGSTKSKKRKRPVEETKAEDIEGAQLPSTWDRELHGVGRTAVVIFVDRPSMEAAIKAVKKARKDGIQPVWGEGLQGTESAPPALGFARYLNHHKLQYPDKKELLESVNNYMSAFSAQEAAQARLRAKQRQEPDEDGFVMVTRGGRNGPAKANVVQEQAEKQKKKRKGLEDFYRFQAREKRKEKAGELVRKFAEDKEK
ncbi:Ribosomal RNA-processing protein 7, partial [Pseudocyphellaria aurata]|nr:Ribosomal RNA-processing protein 7 [Pseudocyphellaria aurata]